MGIQAEQAPRGGSDLAAPALHIPILDLWRALSITLVMCGHLLPLGPGHWGMNKAVAGAGMAMFFILSGFLITRLLIADGSVRRFLARRVARIVPLAWLGVLLALLLEGGTGAELIGNALFYANLPPFPLLPAGGHFWSLSLEVQFYGGVALMVAIGGQRSLKILPLIALCITVARILMGKHMTIVTWFRVDEILAGCTIALIYQGWMGGAWKRWLMRINPLLLLPLLIASAHEQLGPLNYVRPYIAAAMVGASLYSAPGWMRWLSTWRPVIYVANISYGLYVFHGVFMGSWLGAGDTLVKYAKRPLLIVATFICAGLSSHYFERRVVRWVKRQGGLRTPDVAPA